MDRAKSLFVIINAAIAAGREILTVYHTDFTVITKSDNTPLTQADQKAHQVIAKYLTQTGLPILSEEGQHSDFETRKNWDAFWMVDPLDGTKEFVKKNGEFTVNIALIENQKATMGVIYVPVTGTLYYADQQAYKIDAIHKEAASLDDLMKHAEKLPITTKRSSFVVVGSRSHLSEETKRYVEKQQLNHSNVKLISKGSSLKLCMVAEGKADVYPRFAPTMEWDTAAGHAIVEASGAKVIDWKTQKSLKYNKANLLNNWFVVNR